VSVVAFLARVVLGVVLLVAGVSKRADPGWPAAAAELGAPRWSVPVVPVAELVLGALLVTGFGRPWAAWAAAALLGGFTVLLVVRLAQGRRPPCACFGVRSAKPIGPWSLVRNAGLLVLALVAALA
jgi:uncharacterized membrane protein YphA (DoxX/SURF4 family)